MRIIEWLANLINGTDTIDLMSTLPASGDFGLKRFTQDLSVNMIAGLISKCEFKTFENYAPVKRAEWYAWNYEPNVNQNANQFISEIVRDVLNYDEALVVSPDNKQLIIADNCYTHTEKYALYPDTFTSVARNGNIFDRTFLMSDVLYFKLNADDIQQSLGVVMAALNSALAMSFAKYKRSGGRHGKLEINKTVGGNKDKDKDAEAAIHDRFNNYFNSENGVIQMPNGYNYTEIPGDGSKKSTSDVVDINSLTKESISRTAQANKIPPALLLGEIADIEKLMNETLTTCIDPLCRMMETEITRKRYKPADVMNGTFLKIDTTCAKHIDIFDIAVSCDKLISDGLFSVDELLEAMGRSPLNKPWSKQHYITRNYQPIESAGNAEGGETNV